MKYTLNLGQIISEKGNQKSTGTILIPPFRARTLSIDFFCELANEVAKKSTCYHMDYSYMREGKIHYYKDCNPEDEISQVRESVKYAMKKHNHINLIGMCYGGAIAMYLSQDIPINKIIVLSVVDLDNFYSFLLQRYHTKKLVSVRSMGDKEFLEIHRERVDWYKDKKTHDWINQSNTPTLFIGYEEDPYIYDWNKNLIQKSIHNNTFCNIKTIQGRGHRLGNDKDKVFDYIDEFLFNN